MKKSIKICQLSLYDPHNSMKNNLRSSVSVFLMLLLSVLSISCDFISSTNTPTELLLKNAEKHLSKYPDSTVLITNKLIKQYYKNDSDDNQKLKLFQLKYRAFLRLKKMDSVYSTGEIIREVASKIPDSLAIAETLVQLYSDVDYKYIKNAKKYIPAAIATFDKKDMQYQKGMVTALYGLLLSHEGNFKESQSYYFKALKIFEAKDSLKAIGKVYNCLGNNFASANIMDKSTFYYRKSLKIAEIRKDSSRQASVLSNLGINVKTSNPDSAVKIYSRALELNPLKNGEELRMKLEYNLANIYFDQHNFSKAESIYKRILNAAIKSNYQEGIVMGMIALGNVYNTKKQFPLSTDYYKKALQIVESTNQKDVILMLLPELIDVYKNAGDTKNALRYTDQLLQLKDNLFTLDKTKSVLELEKKYQAAKKDSEINNLKQVTSFRYKIILVLLISLFVVLFLWRQRNKLYQENKNAYAVLIQKYKEEKEFKNEKATPTPSSIVKEEQENLEDTTNSVFDKLLRFYETQKPYLDSKLKAEFVAKELGVPQRDIAVTLKNNGYSSFTNFNNKFRVEEIKKCFDSPEYASIKTEAIATQCGFGSKQPFYSAFEEFTGLNPGFYRSEMAKS